MDSSHVFVYAASSALERIAEAGLHGSLFILLSNLAERSVAIVRVRKVPVGVVGEIEGIQPKGERLLSKNWELLQDCDIEVLLCGTVKEIPHMLGGEGAGGWENEDGRPVSVGSIEPGIIICAI